MRMLQRSGKRDAQRCSCEGLGHAWCQLTFCALAVEWAAAHARHHNLLATCNF